MVHTPEQTICVHCGAFMKPHDVFCLLDSDGKLLAPSLQATVLAKYSRSALSAREILSSLTVDEADTVTFNPSAIDPDGDPLVFTYSGWMTTPYPPTVQESHQAIRSRCATISTTPMP